MPDVYACVNEAEKALCANVEEHAYNIALMPDNCRVRVFRNKRHDEIQRIIKSCSESIKTYIWKKFYKSRGVYIDTIVLKNETNDNKIGADLVHVLPDMKKICIEVKFGAQTDKNIGMTVFEHIFGSDAFSKALAKNVRDCWKDLFFDNMDSDAQLGRLKLVLNQAVYEFNKTQFDKGWCLTDEEQEYMERVIINSSGADGQNGDYYLKFILDGEDFSSFSRVSTGIGCWIIHKVEYLSDFVHRVNVFVNNYDTNVQIKYTLNWKNNYKYRGIVAPAKLGLGTPNWNVWVDVEVSRLNV